MMLRIDMGGERVQVGKLSLGGQWLDFYALLALARTGSSDSDTYITAEAVGRIGPWRHKSVASVGKEIARHMKYLESQGFSTLLECQGRTKAWRLRLPPEALCLQPDRETIRAWIDARAMDLLGVDEWVDELRTLVETTVLVQRGETESALEHLNGLQGAAHAKEPALEAWTALLRGTALLPYNDEDEDDELHDLQEQWSKRVDAAGRAVGTRLRVLIVRGHRFEDPSATLASLTKVAADLELRGDVSTLAMVLNVMGLLARRAGDPWTANAHHLRAAALFGLSGDYPSLQAAVFNLAISRREALKRAGKTPDRAVLGLVDLCLFICKNFGVGSDSAQAEIARALWSNEMGDTASARRYLDDAELLVRKLDSTYDQAYFLQARAEIELAHPSGATNPVHDLRTAEMLFGKLGDGSAIAHVQQLLQSLQRSRGTAA